MLIRGAVWQAFIQKNIYQKKFKLVDARSKNRFLGLEKEPRAGIRSGSIKNSYNLPFEEIINQKDNGNWSTTLGQNLVRDVLKLLGKNPRKPEKKDGYIPDWECDDAIY